MAEEENNEPAKAQPPAEGPPRDISGQTRGTEGAPSSELEGARQPQPAQEPEPAAKPQDAQVTEADDQTRRLSRRERKAKAAEERPKITFWQGVTELVIILVLAAVVAVLIQSFFFKAFIIPSSSMSPTLQVGDRVMVDRVTYYFRKPRRGDIVVWRYPPDDPRSLTTSNPFYWPFQQIGETLHITHRGTTPFVKRVVATEGETLQIKKGQVYINGKPIVEPYKVNDMSDFGPVKVPKGMFYGLGDNRPNSRDSRYFGPIPYRAVIGKVILIWWPPSHFGKPRPRVNS
jgi:signal peptidase I